LRHDWSERETSRSANEEREHLCWAKVEGEHPHQARKDQEAPCPTREGRGVPRLDLGGRDESLDEDRENRDLSMRRSRSLRDREAPCHTRDENRKRERLASHVGQKGELAKEEPWTSRVDTPERGILVSNLVVGDSDEKDEEHEPSMEEDKDCKEGNTI